MDWKAPASTFALNISLAGAVAVALVSGARTFIYVEASPVRLVLRVGAMGWVGGWGVSAHYWQLSNTQTVSRPPPHCSPPPTHQHSC
jgi:hypothetical protein